MARVLSFTEFAGQLLDLALTPAQNALTKVAFEGVDPVDLEDESERAIALEIFGGVERVPEEARDGRLFVFRLGRESGKTLILCAARSLYRMCTADLSSCGPGDVAKAAIIAPRRETALAAMNSARFLSTLPKIKPMLVQSAKWGFTLRRPTDGREVVFEVVPKSNGGAALRGFSLVDVYIDESEFVSSGGADAKISDTDIIDAAMPRLVDGGHVTLVSTPWPAPSETSAAFEANFGHPITAIAARANSLLMRNHAPHIVKKYEAELRRKPQNARREFFCELVDGAAGQFFELSTIAATLTDEEPLPTKFRGTCGIDPAFVNDSFGFAGIERDEANERLVVTALRVWTPEPQRPLQASDVFGELAPIVREHLGCSAVATDVHKVKTVRDAAAAESLQVYVGPSIEETMLYLREVLREGQLKISKCLPEWATLVSQLKSVMFRPRSGGGITIIMPRSKDAGHADLVSALAIAVFFDKRHGALLRPKESSQAGKSAPQTFAGVGHVRPRGGGFQRW